MKENTPKKKRVYTPEQKLRAKEMRNLRKSRQPEKPVRIDRPIKRKQRDESQCVRTYIPAIKGWVMLPPDKTVEQVEATYLNRRENRITKW